MLVIDLEKLKTQLNETTYEATAWWTKKLLKLLYGKDVQVVANVNEDKEEPDFIVKGKYKDVKSYAKAVVAEKEFLDAYRQYGTDHPQTEKKRYELRSKVDDFEQTTGLIWPFKDEG